MIKNKYDTIKINSQRDYNLISQEDAMLKFKYLFLDLERAPLVRQVIFEKYNNLKRTKKDYKTYIAECYSKSFKKTYFGSEINFKYSDFEMFERVSKEKKVIIEKRRRYTSLEKVDIIKPEEFDEKKDWLKICELF